MELRDTTAGDYHPNVGTVHYCGSSLSCPLSARQFGFTAPRVRTHHGNGEIRIWNYLYLQQLYNILTKIT